MKISDLTLNLNSNPEKKTESIYQSLQLNIVPSNLKNKDNVELSEGKNRFANNQSLQNVISGKKILLNGSHGDDVKIVQESLKDMGFYPGDKIDGIYGPQTANAIKNFQANRKLPQTGHLDQETMTELNKSAPPANKRIWDKGVIDYLGSDTKDNKIIPSNKLPENKRAKIVISLSEHRLFLYNNDNSIKKVYSIATGKTLGNKAISKTHTGIKVINSKNNDPTDVANQLWPETNGKAFGTKLLDLSWIDLKTGKKTASGEELHGTYVRNSIATNASHGCMRMENEDIEEVFKQVKQGDLVEIKS